MKPKRKPFRKSPFEKARKSDWARNNRLRHIKILNLKARDALEELNYVDHLQQ
jgi:hypothetical protein